MCLLRTSVKAEIETKLVLLTWKKLKEKTETENAEKVVRGFEKHIVATSLKG